ncbi:hypothetical protein [Pedobacter xixiisoli]|uniref:FG-GAP repeat-containing protein n=1 Tax=Pedobacter xixiisoli TaxID=1476464 RepID=A0A286A8T6_9SPHI|nr:hypothetical protein [Pedobacter xixiisoli]SOD18328.1 hypothetical protein SAMN06297358_2944 [Pedobacter xixiisoli]
MKAFVSIISLIIITQFSFAQSDNPLIKKTASKATDFVPKGWKLIAEAKGDLNKDGLEDVALVIENTNPKNIINNSGKLGDPELNTNPRCLLVAFKKPNGWYELFAKNTTFIPPPNAEDAPCLLDPFGENGYMEIVKGLLKIHFQNFYSCGAWEIYNFEYIFRYQHQKFELIGYNKSSMHRSSGEQTNTTVNFSTLKMNYTSGSNAFKDSARPKTIWKNLKPKRLFELSTIHQDSLKMFND